MFTRTIAAAVAGLASGLARGKQAYRLCDCSIGHVASNGWISGHVAMLRPEASGSVNDEIVPYFLKGPTDAKTVLDGKRLIGREADASG